jgi:prevent-host-death family protein
MDSKLTRLKTEVKLFSDGGLMREIDIREFKTKCSALIEKVRKTRKPIRITRLGKPLAEIVPTAPATSEPPGLAR